MAFFVAATIAAFPITFLRPYPLAYLLESIILLKRQYLHRPIVIVDL